MKRNFTLTALMVVFVTLLATDGNCQDDLGGNTLWVAVHDGPMSGNDPAQAIAVDSTGNTYVTGEVCAAQDWTGMCSYRWETVKYDPNGNSLWTARFPGGDPFDWYPFNWPAAIAVDASGNVYVTGSMGTGAVCDELGCYESSSDYATVKYGPDGSQLWLARYNGSGSYGFGTDGAAAVAIDSSGNVYVTGTSYGADYLPHYATLKYDTNGNAIWTARYNGPGNGSDYATAIGLDPSGNIYVTGGSTGVGGSLDYATIKYDSGGNQLWVASYDGPASGDDVAVGLAVGSSGNLYVTGFSRGTSDDYATIRYDSSGNQIWVARYDGPAQDMDRASAIALSPDEHVHVTGVSIGVGTGLDYATIQYDSSGNQIWVARYDGPAHGRDWAHSIAVDAFGRVNVTGESAGIGNGLDYATIQYSPQGAMNWVNRFDGTGHSDDFAMAVAVDASSNVYVTGAIFDAGTNFDYGTLKLSGGPPPLP